MSDEQHRAILQKLEEMGEETSEAREHSFNTWRFIQGMAALIFAIGLLLAFFDAIK